MIENNFLEIYSTLLNEYGFQGWWPLLTHKSENLSNNGPGFAYHPNDYSLPKCENEKFEIILGSILTQNTSWQSVEQALKNLNNLSAIDPFKILELSEDNLKTAIRSAGYYNQKYNYIQNITKFFIDLNKTTPTRKELLEIKGVGNETADSILLYAYKKEEFIVDAYTKRIFSYLGYINDKDSYMTIKKLFESELKNFRGNKIELFQEYHALIVEHAKNYYSKKPYGINDDILDIFKI